MQYCVSGQFGVWQDDPAFFWQHVLEGERLATAQAWPGQWSASDSDRRSGGPSAEVEVMVTVNGILRRRHDQAGALPATASPGR
mmetsp:Transcript_14755/g.25204  ORF Transcript_14755/g.25204 Transcript_14755/m.25204 type:complete len:84 (+) Transcript_14755:269-520(+)